MRPPYPLKTSLPKIPLSDCLVCDSRMHFLYTIRRYSSPIHILECPDCGLQKQAQYPTDMADLYKADYYTGQAEYSYHDERQSERYDRYVWQARLRSIQKFKAPPAKLLDIGCAFGGFIKTAQEMGYQSSGLDLSSYAVEEARKQGLDVQEGMLTSDRYARNSFDIVSMIEVIEHVPNPNEIFTTLGQIIRPGGLLVLQTANFLGRQAQRAGSDYHYYLPGHFVYYSSHNIRLLLEKHSFEILRIWYPVDFGLLAKLKKSRGRFQSFWDYRHWLRISAYHILGKLHWGDWAWNSSMVVYARNSKTELSQQQKGTQTNPANGSLKKV